MLKDHSSPNQTPQHLPACLPAREGRAGGRSERKQASIVRWCFQTPLLHIMDIQNSRRATSPPQVIWVISDGGDGSLRMLHSDSVCICTYKLQTWHSLFQPTLWVNIWWWQFAVRANICCMFILYHLVNIIYQMLEKNTSSSNLNKILWKIWVVHKIWYAH